MKTEKYPVQTLNSDSAEWMKTHGLLSARHKRAIEAISPGLLAAYTFPNATSVARLQLSTDLITWLFLFDDAYADGTLARDADALARVHAQLAPLLWPELPQARPMLASPWARSLHDLLERFEALGAPLAWRLRLQGSLLGYFSACEEECDFRGRYAWPNLQEYLAYRDGSIGVYLMFDLIEFCAEEYLSVQDVNVPALATTRRLGNLAVAMVNDIFSSSKEASEDDSFNAVSVIAHERRISFTSALAEAHALEAELYAGFQRAARRVRVARPSQALRTYVDGIETWMVGNARWSAECGRYDASSPDARAARAAVLHTLAAPHQ